jgi:hypothetical protein
MSEVQTNKANSRTLPFSILIIVVVVLVSLLGGVFLINQGNVQNQEPLDNEVQLEDQEAEVVQVVVNDGENEQSYEVDFQADQSAYDVVKFLSENNEDFDVEFQEFDFGYFIVAINGNKPEVSEAFWKFVVNGEDASVGITDYQVKPDDELKFELDQVE